MPVSTSNILQVHSNSTETSSDSSDSASTSSDTTSNPSASASLCSDSTLAISNHLNATSTTSDTDSRTSTSTAGSIQSLRNENAQRILAFLKEGQRKINLGECTEAILFIGNTGSGKSTTTHFLAGPNDDLISTEVSADSGEFIIVDNKNTISRLTAIAHTLHPQLRIDQETQTALIDCPGFDDNRNEAYDIADAYFIRHVLQTVTSIKIVLTVSYPSLCTGVNRNDFMQLLRHLSILLQDVTSYSDSIALIATKVDNRFTRNERGYDLVPDNCIIRNIAQFLDEVKQSLDTMRDLDQVYTSEAKRNEDEVFFTNTKHLLETLLFKDGDDQYSRIAIFRRPDAPGKLSEIQLLQDGKTSMKKIINNIHYSTVDIANIGYAISDKSKTVIADLVQEINRDIIEDMKLINNELEKHFQHFKPMIRTKDICTAITNVRSMLETLAKISDLEDTADSSELVSVLQDNLTKTCQDTCQCKSILEDISNLSKFLQFLQQIGNKTFHLSVWRWNKELHSVAKLVTDQLYNPVIVDWILQCFPQLFKVIFQMLFRVKKILRM